MKHKKKIDEIVRFFTVGILATGIQYGTYLLMVGWLHPLVANTFAYLPGKVYHQTLHRFCFFTRYQLSLADQLPPCLPWAGAQQTDRNASHVRCLRTHQLPAGAFLPAQGVTGPFAYHGICRRMDS